MPATSPAQQRFMGMVYAYKKGKLKNPSKKIRRAADGISLEDARHFAATKHDDIEEKDAWAKTPVHIQNLKTEYDFESLEDAAAYLSSIGVMSFDDVLKLLSDRVGLINGFNVTYPSEKEAEHTVDWRKLMGKSLRKTAQNIVLVDPSRRYNSIYRANKVLSDVSSTGTDANDSQVLTERVEDSIDHDKRDLKRMKNVLKTLVRVLRGERSDDQ